MSLALLHPPVFAAEAPVIDSFTASAATIAPGGVVTVTVEAHDPDCPDVCTSGCGQYIRADIGQWSADGGTILSQTNSGSGSPFTTSAEWQAPETEDTYTITVYLADSGSFMCGGRQSTTDTVQIQVTAVVNQAPAIDSLSADPLRLFPGGSSTLTCVASDPDGDPLTYEWSADSGAVVGGEPGNATFTAGDPGVATVTCTARDATGAYASDSIALAVTGAEADRAIVDGLVAPHRVAVDSAGRVFVVDPGAGGLIVSDLFSGEMIYRVPLGSVTSVAVDWNGDLLVGGSAGPQLLDRSGRPLAGIELPAGPGDVADVAVDLAARRYGVLHRRAGKVLVYDETGAAVAAFGSTGDGPDQLRSPQGLAATPAGEWVVADSGHGLVKLFGADGTLLRSFGGLGAGAGEFVRMDDVEVDAAGVIWVSDSYQDWVTAFNSDGTLRESLGTYGAGVGELMTAAGVAASGSFDRLLVASTNSSSVQLFRTSDEPLSLPDGPLPTLAPNRLAFDLQAVGTLSAPQPLTLGNSGDTALGITAVTVDGDFAQSNDCGPVIEPGGSCEVAVRFKPARDGDRRGTLIVATSADEGRVAASLAGVAYQPRPLVELSPSLLVFGDQEVETVSPPLPVILANVGDAPLAIGSIEVAGDYLTVHDCSSPLAPGTSCVISIKFAPLAVAEQLPGVLTVTTDAAASPHSVGLDGRGTPIVPSLDIADVQLDEGNGQSVEALLTVTLSRPTSATVQVGYATVSGSARAGEDFEASYGSLTVPPGETEGTIAVPILGDGLLEPDREQFAVQLQSPVSAVVGRGTAVVTILDDEPCVGPELVRNPSAEQGTAESGIVGWTQTAGTSWQPRLAPPQPIDGDYFFYPGTVEYAELAQDVDVSAFTEPIDDGRQLFRFEAWVHTLYEAEADTARVVVEYRNWSNSFALEVFDTGEFSSPSKWLRIADERLAPPGTSWIRVRLINTRLGDAYFDAVSLRSLRAPTVSIDDLEVYEGDYALRDESFTVRLACPFSAEVAVDYATGTGSAVAGEDYLPGAGRVFLPIGETSTSIPVTLVGDQRNEPHDTLAVELTRVEPTDALLLDREGVCLIRNDDFCPQGVAYWRSSPERWPADALELGGVDFDRDALTWLLGDAPHNDAANELARELIATKFNLLVGSKPFIIPVAEQADAFLAAYPPGSKPQGDDRKLAEQITSALAQYNHSACGATSGGAGKQIEELAAEGAKP